MSIEVDTSKPCKAILTISVMVAEPLKDEKGVPSWRPVHVDNDSLSVNLEGYNHQDLAAQVREKIQEFKQLWGPKIISLESLPNDAEKTLLKTAEE